MTVDEAIAVLKAEKLFKKVMKAHVLAILGEGVVSTRRYKEMFQIEELEAGGWALDLETGQAVTHFRISSELEDVVRAAISYFQMLNLHLIDSLTFRMQLLHLQFGGLVTEIDGSAAITCQELSVRSRGALLQKYRFEDTDWEDLLEFMRREKDPHRKPLYILTPAEHHWTIQDHTDETQPVEYTVGTLEEAVQQVLSLYSGPA